MKRSITISIFSIAVIAITTFSLVKENNSLDQNINEKEELNESRNAQNYLEWVHSMRVNPKTGKLSFEDIYNGKMEVYDALAKSDSRGGSLLNLEWENMGPNNVGGRTRSIAFDVENPDRMYAGSVSGGLFISENGGLDWTPSPGNETLGSLLISSIAVATNGDIYIGTGESADLYGIGYLFDGTSSFSHTFTGDGIYKSTDKGLSFLSLPETQPSPGTIGATNSIDWAYVTKIVCHPSNPELVAAGMNGGLMFSTNGGDTWEFSSTSGNLMDDAIVGDLVFDSDGFLHAIYGAGFDYYKSTSSTDISNMNSSGEGLPTSSIGRAVIAVASDPSYIYYYSVTTGGDLQGVYRSTDGGNTFSVISPAASDLFNPPGINGAWNVALAVNPGNKDIIYLGGAEATFTWRAATGAWTQMSYGYYPEYFSKYVHADQHVFVFHPENPEIMYVGSDGGVARSLNAYDVYPDFQTMNKGYNVTQFHSVGFGLFGDPVAGTQDNGSQYVSFRENSKLQSIEVTGGDGGKGEVSRIRTEYIFTEIYFAALRRSVNGGESASSIFDCNIDYSGGGGTGCSPDGKPDIGGEFVAEFKLWENWDLYDTFKGVIYGDTVEYPSGSGDFYTLNDSVDYEGRNIFLNRSGISESRLYLATNNNLWVTNGALFNSTEAPEWFKVLPATSGNVSAVEFDNSGDVVYVGTSSGKLYRLEGLLGATYKYVDEDWDAEDEGITSYLYPEAFGGRITGINIDRDNANEIVLSVGGFGIDDNVYYSDDALSNDAAEFLSIADNLPNIPVFDVEMHKADNDIILAATEFGVWSYSVSAGGDWTQENSLIGNVPVFEIREDWVRDQSCFAIYIGTHGRGFLRSTTLAASGCEDKFALENDTALVDAGPIQEEIIAGIVLAPNPADILTEVSISLLQPATISTRVYNMSGFMVKSIGEVNYTSGSHKFSIDVASLLPGSYLVVFDINGILISRKIIIV